MVVLLPTGERERMNLTLTEKNQLDFLIDVFNISIESSDPSVLEALINRFKRMGVLLPTFGDKK